MKRLIFQITVFILFLRAALSAENPKLVPALGWDIEKQGGFPLCLAADAQNAIWVGTEGKGLWRFDPREKKWTQFTTRDGLGDDSVYALAVDKFDRVWVGHLNHGVSVWNGEKWRNYDLLDGPIGDHIFAIAIGPTDGDVWLATELGLARYSVSKKDWDYFTRASGLPSDQIQCLAFEDNGDLYAGTQCDGIAIGEAADHYKKWRTVSGPNQMPNAVAGQGLPSNLINSISILHPAIPMPGDARDSKVVAATPVGMAGMPIIGNANPGDEISVSINQTWAFMRGADWQLNVNGLLDPPAPAAARVPLGEDQTLLEDWTTCVQQEGAAGRVWMGYRHRGLEIRSADAGRIETRVTSDGSDALWVRAILLPPNSPPLIAIYDGKIGGLMTLDSSEKTPLEPTGEPRGKAADFPTPAKAPTADTFKPLTTRVAAFKNEFEPGDGVYLGDDWRTGGDWVAHYGGSFAKLCGALASGDRDYEEEPDCAVTISTGPHTKTDRSPPRNIGAPNTFSSMALYDPSLGHRIEAEISDDSAQRDQYPPDWEGPDLWVDLDIPEGVHCVSLYFQNNDVHTGSQKNKLRDYDVQLLPWSDDAATVQKAEPIARTRVNDFWGGVYKQFVVCGPSRYVIRIGRNRSFVTKLQGVFVDRLSGDAPDKESLPGFEEVEYEPPVSEIDPGEMEKDETLSAANDLWSALDDALDMRGTMSLQLPLRIWAYRAAVAGKAPKELLAVWRWQIGIWTPEDRKDFQKAMAEAYKAYSEEHPEAKSEGGDAQ